MSDSRYQRTTLNGFSFDRWTKQRIILLMRKFPGLIITQGSWSYAGTSANTHAGAGVVDFYLGGHAWKDVLRYAFQIGFFGWYRPAIPGVWKAHLHLGIRGNKNMDPTLKAQYTSWINKRNGLKGNGPDFYTYRPANYKQPSPYKLTRITVMELNIPAPGVGSGSDLGNDAGRIKAMVRLRDKAKPHVICWNELGPVKKVGTDGAQSTPSDFARAVDAALGPDWYLIKPTKAWNENYISFRKPAITHVRQYDDSILESPSGNKHLTREVLKHVNGLVFGVGVMHLVPGSSATARRDQQVQGGDAFRSMAAVSAKHRDCPFILTGDVNNPHDLTALVKAGMKRARKYADVSDGPKATYTNYDKTKPSTNAADWEIDSSYWSKSWYVNTWHVIRDLVIGGYYRKPRASDHDATVTTATSDWV